MVGSASVMNTLRITQPDALLLDEPTKHLDSEEIGLLEAWTKGWRPGRPC